jgi:hypothetical protein
LGVVVAQTDLVVAGLGVEVLAGEAVGLAEVTGDVLGLAEGLVAVCGGDVGVGTGSGEGDDAADVVGEVVVASWGVRREMRRPWLSRV